MPLSSGPWRSFSGKGQVREQPQHLTTTLTHPCSPELCLGPPVHQASHTTSGEPLMLGGRGPTCKLGFIPPLRPAQGPKLAVHRGSQLSGSWGRDLPHPKLSPCPLGS